MNRDELDGGLEALGDGCSAERLARQRVRLIEWERSRMRPPAWYLGRPMIAALGAVTMVAVLFGVGKMMSVGERSQVAAHSGTTAVPKAPVAAVSTPAPALVQLSGTLGSEPLVAGQWFDATHHAVELQFAEGSRLEFAAGARGRLAELGNEGLRLSIESGHLNAQIVPGGRYRWLIHAGPYLVKVVGTAFSVDWQPDAGAFVVAVSRGTVEVTEGGAADGRAESWVRQLKAGETLRVQQGKPAMDASSPSVSSLQQAVASEPSAKGAPRAAASEHARSAAPSGNSTALGLPGTGSERAIAPPATHRSIVEPHQAMEPSTTSWKVFAEKGEYREAFAAAQTAGFERLAQGASVSDLLLLADTARLSGASEPARRALLLIRERYPSHVNASRAGFLLGRLAFEQKNDTEAVRWLRDYLAQKPTGPLAEGARSRLLLALKRLGDRASAKAAALDYLQHYPQGRTADAARDILSE